MTVTLSSSNFTRSVTAGSAAPTIVLPVDVPAGAAIVLGVFNRSNTTTTISSVTDPVNGTWGAARQGPTDNGGTSQRTWIYVFDASAALSGAGNRTITVNFSGAINSHLIAGWVSSSLGSMSYDAVATVYGPTSNTTTWVSNNATATAAGCIVGFWGANNGQTANPTLNGAGEVQLSSRPDEFDSRSMAYGEIYTGAGSYGFDITAATTCAGNFHVVAIKEPAAAGTVRRMMLLGVG